MKRSNFLKSLLIGIVAPKVVAEAIGCEADRKKRFNENKKWAKGWLRSYGDILKLPPVYGYFYRDRDSGIIGFCEMTEAEAVNFKGGILLHKRPPNGVYVNVDAIQNLQL